MPKIPQSIGTFKILGSLGRGGTSQVYKALHPTLKKTVVLKKLTLKGSGPIRERFQREADLMMGFNHNHIVRVYDIFKEGSSWIIVQEYVDGPNLEDVVRSKGGLGKAASLRVVVQCLKALVYIHKMGIIHRDIKPSNIFLTARGKVKLGDFGIASRIEGGKGLTREGAALGTPDFMAPEQVLNPSSVDGRADIYALALTWYEAWTGKPYPRRGPTVGSVRFSWAGHLLRKGARKRRFFRFSSAQSLLWQIRITLFPLLLSKKEAPPLKEENKKSKRTLLLVPIIVILIFGGRFLYYGVIKDHVYGTFRLEVPYSENTAPWYLGGVKARLYRQEQGTLRGKRRLWMVNFRKIDELRSGNIYLSTGSYALQLSLLDREEWHSFFITPQGEVLRMEPLDFPLSPLDLEITIFDSLTGTLLTEASVKRVSREEEQQEPTLSLLPGEKVILSFSCPGYQLLEKEFSPTGQQERISLRVGLLPLPGDVTIQFAQEPAGGGWKSPVKINGSSNYLSWDGDPHWEKILFEGPRAKLILPPGLHVFEVFPPQGGEVRTVNVELLSGEKRTIYVD